MSVKTASQAPRSSKPTRLHEQIEVKIRHTIHSQGLKAGDQLPTEIQLCQEYGVSRSTIRLALKQLEREGLVSRTRSRGTFLTAPSSLDGVASYARHATNEAEDAPGQLRKTVGIVLRFSADTDALQMGILLGVEHAARSRGYNVTFARSSEDEEGEANAIEHLLQSDVAGLIVMPISERTHTRGVRAAVIRSVPLVLVDRYLSGLETSYVTSDNASGAYHATEHLILLGYRSLRFVHQNRRKGVPVTTSVRDRYAGFCKALREYGLARQIRQPVALDTSDEENVRRVIDARSSKPQSRPVAIVAASDNIAIRFMNAAAQRGKRPPEDFAIVGFDDLPIASQMSVPLTSVLQPRYDMGFRAGHLLVDKIEGYPVQNNKIVLPVSLVVRESCGARRLVQARKKERLAALEMA